VVIPSIESVINVSIQPECRTFSCNVFWQRMQTRPDWTMDNREV
jgi:hypothetical protein